MRVLKLFRVSGILIFWGTFCRFVFICGSRQSSIEIKGALFEVVVDTSINSFISLSKKWLKRPIIGMDKGGKEKGRKVEGLL